MRAGRVAFRISLGRCWLLPEVGGKVLIVTLEQRSLTPTAGMAEGLFGGKLVARCQEGGSGSACLDSSRRRRGCEGKAKFWLRSRCRGLASASCRLSWTKRLFLSLSNCCDGGARSSAGGRLSSSGPITIRPAESQDLLVVSPPVPHDAYRPRERTPGGRDQRTRWPSSWPTFAVSPRAVHFRSIGPYASVDRI